MMCCHTLYVLKGVPVRAFLAGSEPTHPSQMPLVRLPVKCQHAAYTLFFSSPSSPSPSPSFPLSHSIRDGVMLELLARDLVMGDIVYISLGDRVPADIRLMEVRSI